MPAPQGSLYSQLTKVLFDAKMLNLPTEWEDQGDQFSDAFDPSELTVPPNPPLTLFREATLNKYHVDTAKDIGADFAAYIDGICNAICSGIGMWMLQAKFTNLKIMAVSAIGTPGCFSGPELEGLITPSAPQATEMEKKYSDAIAAAFSTKWKDWQDGLTCPGLPFYPAFAAFPSAMAPPMPNVPFPLIAFPSSKVAGLMPSALKDEMVSELDDSEALHHEALFDSLATAFATIFLTFQTSTMVSLVMGQGPVPSFAPPFVPVGPVINGSVIAAPPHLM